MKKIKLHWQILFSLLLAIVFGALFPQHVEFVSWLGIIFMNALKMVVVPLVFCSLVAGVSNIGLERNLGRLGIKTLAYYLSTSLLAILTGLVLVNIFKPGAGKSDLIKSLPAAKAPESKHISETLLDIVPVNIFEAFSNNGKMISIILFAILFGFFIIKVNPPHKKVLTSFFKGAFEVMMKITLLIIKFAPFGIFGIVSGVVAEQADLFDLAKRLANFMWVVFLGLGIHSLLTLPFILFFVGKINPVKQIKAVGSALLTAFSTASSNATLPLTMETIEDNAGVSNKISSFTLPLGATINMDGTALYELVVVGFITQIYGMELSIGQQLIVVLTALLSSIGTAGIPMASYAAMAIIFSAIDLPIAAIALILPIDRPLDMLRTATNVFGDTCGAAVIAASEGEKLNVKL